MNWTKVKIILIVLFVFVNIMLIGILYGRNTDDSKLSAEYLNEIKIILSKNGIEADSKLITSETADMTIPEATPITSYNSSFVKQLQKDRTISEKGDFVSENTVVSVYEDVVHIENSGEAENTLYSAEESAEKFFSEFGIDVSGCLETRTEKDNTVVLKYVQKYNGYDIFGSYAEAEFCENTIKSANIVWYEISEKNIQSAKTISSAEVLLDFAADKTRGVRDYAVKSVSLGYTAETDGTGTVQKAQMIPTAEITTDIDSIFFYDIRNPE